jgi:hypothetical protein
MDSVGHRGEHVQALQGEHSVCAGCLRAAPRKAAQGDVALLHMCNNLRTCTMCIGRVCRQHVDAEAAVSRPQTICALGNRRAVVIDAPTCCWVLLHAHSFLVSSHTVVWLQSEGQGRALIRSWDTCGDGCVACCLTSHAPPRPPHCHEPCQAAAYGTLSRLYGVYVTAALC